jgi:hypothetical protein
VAKKHKLIIETHILMVHIDNTIFEMYISMIDLRTSHDGNYIIRQDGYKTRCMTVYVVSDYYLCILLHGVTNYNVYNFLTEMHMFSAFVFFSVCT